MKKIKYLIFFIFVFFIPTIQVFAEEKTKIIEAELQQDYVQCTFYLSFENEIVENSKIITPRGEEYELLASDGFDGLKRTFKNVQAGTYKVVITKDISDEDIPNDSEAQDIIGKVTLKVTADEESTTSITSDLKLAKEIAGLHYYWRDDDIVVEWTDETCGNVEIVVVDSKTLQIIDKRVVSNMYYSCNIKPSVNEILLKVIPSVSNGVNGAGEEYAIKVDNHPDAEIVFTPTEYTNQDYISAKAILNQPYSLLYINNGKEVGKKELQQSGTYEIEVPTVNGNNDVKVYVIDQDGNMRSTSIQFIKDTEPPILKIKNDITGLQTYENEISFSGTVENFDSLSFRNSEVSVDWEGKFEIHALLEDGENELVLTASDAAGNISEYRAVVTKLVVEEKVFPWKVVIVIIGFFVIVAVVYILLKIQKKIKMSSSKKSENQKNHSFSKYRKKNEITDYICFLISIGIYLVLLLYVFNIGTVQSSSMEPTVKTNELIVTNCLAYKIKSPKRGDIITFRDPTSGTILLKRIVGLPGDEVTFVDGYVFLNGIICDESEYLAEEVETNSSKNFVVPEKSYFVMGDNRENSVDSRFFKEPYVKENSIIGKLLFHIYLK